MHRKKRETLVVLACALVVSALVLPGAAAAKKVTADTVLQNGFVYTVENHGCSHNVQTAHAVAILDGKIIFVGTDCAAKKYIGPNTTVFNLHGKMVMPGLQDGHTHLQGFVPCNMGYEGGTEDYVLGKIKAALLREDQLPFLNTNYVLRASYFFSESMLPVGTQLTRDMLDRLSKPVSSGDPMATGTTRPIRVTNADGHKYHLNSIAITNGSVTAATVAPPGSFIGHYANGEPNGIFADYSTPTSIGPNPPQPENAAYLGVLESMRVYNSKGTTSFMRAGGSASNLQVLKQLADDGVLTARVNQSLSAGWVRGETDAAVLASNVAGLDALKTQYDGYSSPASPGTIAVDTVKIFADGVAEYPAQTAAMLEPYNVNVGTDELPIWTPGTLRGEDPSVDDATLGFTMLDADHWTIHVHAIGNRAVRATLDNYAAARKANGRWDSRHAMVHVQFVDPKDMRRFGALKVVPVMQLQWAERDTYTIDTLQPYVSPAVFQTMYPARSLMKGGAVVAGGSDFPVDALNPFKEIEIAVLRSQPADELGGVYDGVLNPSECLTLAEALRMHTMGTAYQLHQDDVTGSIKAGKYADLIVLDQNLLKIPASQISDTKVLLTLLGGKVVWQDSVNPL